jgi:hypothetical protein
VKAAQPTNQSEGQAEYDIHRRPSQRDKNIVHPTGPRIQQGNLNGFTPTDEAKPGRRARQYRQKNHEGWDADGPDGVGVGEGVERNPALRTWERVSPQIGDPGMAKFMEANGDNQKDQAEQAPANLIEGMRVHLLGAGGAQT